MFRDQMRELSRLCGYFHQDWVLDHANADAVLDFCLEQEARADVERANAELSQLLGLGLKEEELRPVLLDDLGCEYEYTAGGWPSARAWLEHVQARLVERLAQVS